nr:tRNA 2-thiouridine(34) synthase MnmA [Melioribacteraceae bacterium]
TKVAELIEVVKKSGIDDKKDQSYALWGLTQESLSRTLFPLSNYTKEHVRFLADKFKLRTAKKPDSQEICFVADNDYHRFLNERSPEIVKQIKEGDLVYKGKVVGRHKGIPFYTIGQRKGLGVTFGKPAYVTEIDYKNNKIFIGDKEELLSKTVKADDINYVSVNLLKLDETIFAKIRYKDIATEAKVIKSTTEEIVLEFLEMKLSVTPGQSLVIYDKEGYVLAGGLIKNNT